MSVRNDNLGGSDWVDGEVLYDYDLDDTFDEVAPSAKMSGSIYTGSDFNASAGGSANHTIQISSSELRSATYLIVNVSYVAYATGSVGADGSVTFRIETQETGGGGGGWSDLLGTTTVCRANSAGGAGDADTNESRTVGTLRLVKTLTAGELSNGIDVKFTTTTSAPSNATASLSNEMVWFEGLN